MRAFVVKVDSEIPLLAKDMTDLEKNKFPWAMKRALDKTAMSAKAEIGRQIGKDFDRPTPYSRKQGVFAVSAKYRDWHTKGHMFSMSGLKDIQASYLGKHVDGGSFGSSGGRKGRNRSGKLRIPLSREKGKRVPLNQYGNVDQRWLNKTRYGNATQGIYTTTYRGKKAVWQFPRAGNDVTKPTMLMGLHQSARYRGGKFKFFNPIRLALRDFPYHFRRELNMAVASWYKRRGVSVKAGRIRG